MTFSYFIFLLKWHITHRCIYYYEYIKYIYSYYFQCTIIFFENVIVWLYGEDMLEVVWDHWNRVVCFYSTLWHIYKKRIYDKLETISLELIWKIKRSSNPIVKALAKYLSKYPWFNNYIIKF